MYKINGMISSCLDKQIIMYTFGYEIHNGSISMETEIKIIISKPKYTHMHAYKHDLPV